MRVRDGVARLRATWADLDRKRHELEHRIASYNVPDSSPAARARLDGALEEILGRDGEAPPGETGRP
jgi:hypothetical protein